MSTLPGAGWYDDGVTAGVVRWFDGAAWTEHTRAVPAPAGPVLTPAGPVAAAAHTSTIGRVPTGRLGDSLNLADRVTENAAFRRHRHEEALALRRRGFWMFAFAVAVLLLAGAVGIAMGGADTVWYVGAVGAALLCARAGRDYRNATFRGAPALSATAWVGLGIALVVALAVFAAAPVIAIHQLAHLGDTVR